MSQEEFFNRQVASADLGQYFHLERGDFAYNKSYSAGYPAGVVRNLDLYDSGVVSPLYICFRVDSRVADPSFVMHYFESGILNDAILGIAKEGVRNHGLLNVKVGDFFSLDVNLPSLDEQRRITEILDAVNEQISVNREIVEKLQRVREGVLDHLFADGTVEGRCGASTQVGEIPDSWRVASLRELCDIDSGGTPSRAEGDIFFSTSGTPWVKTLDLNEGWIRATSECVTDLAIRQTRLRIYPPGTVLVAMYGGWAQIGRTGCLAVPATVNQAVCALRVKAEVIPEFLMLALQHGRFRWRRFAASTRKDPNITKSDVCDFLVPVPSISEQESIVQVVDSYSDRLRGELEVGQRLESLRKALMDDVLTGCVRVPVSAKR
ncbi:restriction endonuclease subunit S [Streptomyces vinaceus]|uniref:restriction endonuclease subunit S n=1 Tax=Streptomyces vinaceus TaxID=1960 RepID=UPI00381430E9